MRTIGMLAAGVAAIALSTQAHAQQAETAPQDLPTGAAPDDADAADDAAADDDDYEEDIVVTGSRAQPGAVVGDIPPELQLSPADVRAYGVGSIAELLEELSPQTTSGRGGRPVILLSGRRISSFAEIRDLPTEAILRVDILPEEVALKYGYSADQKVVNFVLRRRFRSFTLEARDTLATAGGRNTPRAELGLVNLSPQGRFSLNLEYQQSDRLFERDRDLVGRLNDDVHDLAGNITPAPGANEIDPALSAAAGFPVTVAGVPATAAGIPPAIGDFATAANVTDLSRYRTLLPAARDFAANAVLARTVFGNVQATANGRIEVTDSMSDRGLPGISVLLPTGSPFSPFANDVVLNRLIDSGLPLRQSTATISSHAGLSFNGDISPKWRWSLTGNVDRTTSDTVSDIGVDASALQDALLAGQGTINPFGPLAPPLIQPLASNTANARSTAAGADLLVNGTVLALPAGDLSTSLRIGAQTSELASRSFRNGVFQAGQVSRDSGNGRINLDVPLTSRRKAVLGALGDLSANANLAVDRLSDFGTLTSTGYGLHWSPLEEVRALVSFTDKEAAPSAEQLGSPVISTPNARVFDFVRGETVDVTQLGGGNPALAAETRHIFRAEINVKPISGTDLTLTATYTGSRGENAIASFPAITAAIQQAFPERFVRAADGRLLSVDTRPINFAREQTRAIRWGFNISKPIKSKLQRQIEAYRNGEGPSPFPERAGGEERRAGGERRADDAARGDGPREERAGGGGRFGGGFGGRRGGGGRSGGGRVQFAIYHTWNLESTVLIREGLPELDLLNGDVTGSGGGASRHKVEVRAGYSNNGLGARLNADWQSGTRVNAGTAGAAEQLNFASLGTVDLRLFADLSAQRSFVRQHPWAQGMRVTLSVNNLFDQRQRVTDATGATPISYQPYYLDPLGRSVTISLRKLFFQRSSR